VSLSIILFIYSEYEGNELIRKRDGEYKLPYPLVSPLKDDYDLDFRFESSRDFHDASSTPTPLVALLSAECRHLKPQLNSTGRGPSTTRLECFSNDDVTQAPLTSRQQQRSDEVRLQSDGEDNCYSSVAIESDVKSMDPQRWTIEPSCYADSRCTSSRGQHQSFGSFIALLNYADDTSLPYVDCLSNIASCFCRESNSPHDVLGSGPPVTPPCDGGHYDVPSTCSSQLYIQQRQWNGQRTSALSDCGNQTTSSELTECNWTPRRGHLDVGLPISIDCFGSGFGAPERDEWKRQMEPNRASAIHTSVETRNPEYGRFVVIELVIYMCSMYRDYSKFSVLSANDVRPIEYVRNVPTVNC